MAPRLAKIRGLRGEARGEVLIAERSERPGDLSRVMRTVIIPELLDILIPASNGQEIE